MIEIKVPSSKSLTQRALVVAALSDRPCLIQDPLDCDDSKALIAGLAQLGICLERRPDGWLVKPPESLQAPSQTLQLGNAGTAVRFLTGLAPLVPGAYVIDGIAAMRRRPMPGLLTALRTLGVEVEELGDAHCPPLRLTAGSRPDRFDAMPCLKLKVEKSSQQLSALLMAGCRLKEGLQLEVEGHLPSRSYVDLTLSVLADFGVAVERQGADVFRVPNCRPGCDRFRIEADWSSASYPLAAAWLKNTEVGISNLAIASRQGDRVFSELLHQLDAPGPARMNLVDSPDIVPTVVACALFARQATEITGVAHLRIKESDRIAVLARQLHKLGADLVEREDGLVVKPGPLHGPARLDPAGDHRMAMCFGLVGLRVPGIEIMDPECVSKSYPDFWEMLAVFA